MEMLKNIDYYTIFEYKDMDVYISSLKHHLKTDGEKKFVATYEKEPSISDKVKILYLVSLIEMLCNKCNLGYPTWINKYTHDKMDKVLFSKGVMIYCEVVGNTDMLKEKYKNAIKEFKQHNIIETDIYDVI